MALWWNRIHASLRNSCLRASRFKSGEGYHFVRVKGMADLESSNLSAYRFESDHAHHFYGELAER